MVTRRRRARELALQFLYQLDMAGGRVEEAGTGFWDLVDALEPQDRNGREVSTILLIQGGIDAFALLTEGEGALSPEDLPAFAPASAPTSQSLAGEAKEFSLELVTGVKNRLQEIDGLIEQYCEHWKIGRMAVVDRNILRLAVFELIERRDIPSKVSINEAIELGKTFGSDESGPFINGVLDRIRLSLDL